MNAAERASARFPVFVRTEERNASEQPLIRHAVISRHNLKVIRQVHSVQPTPRAEPIDPKPFG